MVGLAAACARQGAPPGGPEDRRPPVVVATHPDTFAVLTEPFRGPVRFEFDERISERTSGGTLEQAVVVSPRTGRVRVGHGRQSISVDLDGGFRPGLVYRVTLLPVFRDLFNNQMTSPFEVVFSTGGDFNASAVAGTVWDRVTAAGVEAMEVLAWLEGADSAPHVARTDTAGVYIFRYLPPGPYSVIAYQDRNRNGVVDRMELQGTGSFQVGGADTLFLDVPVLQPDTTPARLIRATVVDSLTVLLEFDDALDPTARSDLMDASLAMEEGGDAGRVMVFHEREYTAWRSQMQDSFARLDSAEAAQRAMEVLEEAAERRAAAGVDTAAADTAPAAPPALRQTPQVSRSSRPLPPMLPPATSGGGRAMAPAVPGGGAIEPLAPDGTPLPSSRLALRLQEFLEASVAYRVSVHSVVNINGVGGGGGEATLVRELPKDTASAADTVAADTVAADTAGMRADTIPPDTIPPDTIPPDTVPPPAVPNGPGGRLLVGERRR
jgi:hypothetical protein